MRVGWLAGCGLALAGGVAQAQNAAQTQTTVTIDRGMDGSTNRSDRMSGHAGSSLASGGPAQAALLAKQALEKDQFNPWAHYRRAAALSDLKRTDEAVAAYKAAEEAFTGRDDRGKSLAIYGRAFTLAQAGRCTEAQPAFEQYAQFVESKDPKGASQARSYAHSCRQSAPEQGTAAAPAEPPRQEPQPAATR
jgi:tetratricopeptide (TPR) repeat protein